MGDGLKLPSKREWPERFWARRGTYAKMDLKKGDIVSYNSVSFLRPCKGIPVESFESVCGKRLKRDILSGEPIAFEDFE